MNPKFQLQISIVNYSESNRTINREVTLEEIAEFSPLFKAVVLNGNVTTWNWWNHLPDTWNGEKYVGVFVLCFIKLVISSAWQIFCVIFFLYIAYCLIL